LLWALAWLVASAPGRAAPAPPELGAAQANSVSVHAPLATWTRGRGAQLCPTQEQFRAELTALGAPTFADPAPAVNVRVERETPGWVALIHVTTASGQDARRELHSDAEPCDGIFSAAAVATLLILESEVAPAAAQPAEPRAADEHAKPTAEPSAADDRAKPSVDPQRAPVALEHSFELGAIVAHGVLPHLALGAAARYGFPLSAGTALSLRGLLLPEQHVRQGAGGLGFSLLALGLGLCHRFWQWEESSLLGSLDVHLGRLRVDVEPPLQSGRSGLLWSWANVALRGERRLGSALFVAAELSLGVPLGPLHFGVAGGDVLAEVDPVTISTLVSLGLHF
jgi:hypothetical protein